MSTHLIRIPVNISYDDFLPYYEGHVKVVVATDLDGKTVRFPASALQPYLTHVGVSGMFELRIDEDNKLISCERISHL